MATDFVWAIDENGKPTKCTAKPENRGKRNCKHRFHARPGEDDKSFFKRYMIDPTSSDIVNGIEKIEELTIEDLPDYTEAISNLVHPISRKYDNWSDVVTDVMNNKHLNNGGIPFLEGVEKKVVSEEIDPDNPDAVKITMSFTVDGEEHLSSFSIPRVNENGEIYLNGVPYRCVPVLEKFKKGIEVSKEGNIKLKNSDDDNVITINKGKDEGYLTWYSKFEDENGAIKYKKEHSTVPLSEIDKELSGKESNLTEEEKKVVASLDDVAVERWKEIGMDGIKKLPPDDLNSIDYRAVATYEDRVAFSISKKFKSVDSIYRKRLKNGEEQEFNLDNTYDIIKKDLQAQSCVRIAENINPIAALSQSEAITYCGPGAWAKHSIPEQIRLTHESYYGIIDNNDVSLGGNIGATIALKNGYVDKHGIIRKSNEDNLSCSDFMPFLEHSDPNRGAMAVSQMKQAVPIIGGEDPIVSTKGWDKIKGSKLGVNFNVAYVPDPGVWEDAVVISESAAKKMTTVQTKKYSKQAGIPVKQNIGDEIKRGERVGGTMIEYPGKLKSVDGDKIVVESVYPMTVGDKLAGRHGNKGVVSKILPDNEMPTTGDGTHADIIMSPIGIAGRSNLGQVYEVNGGAGRVNDKTELEYQGHKIEATYGKQFVMRLNQIADKKLHSESNNRDGSKEFRARFGEMESLLMTSSEQRLEILNFLKHQETNMGEEKLMHTLRSIGVDLKPAQ